MEIWRERNVGTTIYFPLIDRGSQDFESTPVSFAASDVQFSVDGGAFGNTTNSPAHEGNGIYSLVLTGAEVNGQNTVLTLIDAATKAWEDQAIVITTYGDASAEHAFNLNDAVPPVDVVQWNSSAVATPGVAGVPEVDVTHFVGGVVPTPFTTGIPDVNVQQMLDITVSLTTGDLDVNVAQIIGTAPSLTSGDLDVNVAAMAAGTITAAAVASGAIDADALSTDGVTEIAAAVWGRDATLSQTQGTFGQAIGDPVADASTIWALVNANLDATVSSRAIAGDAMDLVANAVDAAAVAVGAITADAFAAGAIDAAAIATDAIDADALATDAVDEITAAVWDKVLTGVTHNVVNSAGRRIRQHQEAGTYGGSIWVDTVNGTAGTTNFENGTDTSPVDNMADANTIAASVGISRFKIAPGSTITLAAAQTNQQFEGVPWTLNLGGQNIDGSTFAGAIVSGIATNTAGTQFFIGCVMGTVTLPGDTRVLHSALSGVHTLGEVGDYFYDHCHSSVAGTSSPVLDFGAALNASNVGFRSYSGGIEIRNMGAGTGSYNMSLEGDGQLIINANCSATSTVAIRGHFPVTDNAGGAVTLSDDARFDVFQIATVDWDEPLADHTVAGTFGEKVNNIPLGMQKNVATNDIAFLMVLTSNHVSPATGLTVTGQRSIDGGAFAAVTGSIAEIGGAVGMYQFDASQADMNGDIITFRFSSGTADDRFLTIVTSP